MIIAQTFTPYLAQDLGKPLRREHINLIRGLIKTKPILQIHCNMQLQKPDVPDFHYDSSSSINGASDVDEVHSSTGSASSAHQSSADRQSSEESETKRRLRNETTLIRTWKVTTLLAIVTVAAMVSTGCYKILREQERRDFETNVSSKATDK